MLYLHASGTKPPRRCMAREFQNWTLRSEELFNKLRFLKSSYPAIWGLHFMVARDHPDLQHYNWFNSNWYVLEVRLAPKDCVFCSKINRQIQICYQSYFGVRRMYNTMCPLYRYQIWSFLIHFFLTLWCSSSL